METIIWGLRFSCIYQGFRYPGLSLRTSCTELVFGIWVTGACFSILFWFVSAWSGHHSQAFSEFVCFCVCLKPISRFFKRRPWTAFVEIVTCCCAKPNEGPNPNNRALGPTCSIQNDSDTYSPNLR